MPDPQGDITLRYSEPAQTDKYIEDGIEFTELDDDMVSINLEPDRKPLSQLSKTDHEYNLAEALEDGVLALLAEELLRGVESDLRSRSKWENTVTKAMDMLGLEITESGDLEQNGTVSKVHHGLMLDAIINYQSDAGAELYPAVGPVKVEDNSSETDSKSSEKATLMERKFNHYLTDIAKEYYPDNYRMLFAQGLMGDAFKKIYHCPMKERQVSKFVSAIDLIVSNDATDLEDVGRVTHRVRMRQNVMKRMQILGVYRSVDLDVPAPEYSEGEEKIADIEGTQTADTNPEVEDIPHELYETYAELDIPGFSHPKDLPIPYKVTIDVTSRRILEIRRNWKEGDGNYQKRNRFVKYPFIPGLGFYGYGCAHVLGQDQKALTALERELIDAGMFANFPGFLQAKHGPSQNRTNQIRVMPGQGVEVDTGGLPIKDSIMDLPYKEPSATLLSLATGIADMARKKVGAAHIPVGEGTANIPVGTLLAMIELATKPMSAIHKRNHNAQQREFQILQELFMEDPSPLWKFSKDSDEDKIKIKEAISDISLVPAADPNTPSNIHRIMRTWALMELAKASPDMYDLHAVHKRALSALAFNDEELLKPPPPPGAGPQQEPSKIDEIQLEAAVREGEQSREMQQDIVRGKMKENLEDKKLLDRAQERQHEKEMAALKYGETELKEKGKFMGILGKFMGGGG